MEHLTDWGEYYHKIASSMQLYQQTNQRLVEAAQLRPAMAVVDLACGSGLTAAAALKAVPEGLSLSLVDTNQAMIAAAKRRLGAKVHRYVVADAERFAQQIDQKADRVLCNLSFWLFRDPEEVLRQVRSILQPNGRFYFNLSSTYFNAGGGLVSPLWLLLRILHEKGILAKGPPNPERLPNQRSVEAALTAAGFKPLHYEVQEVEPSHPESGLNDELSQLLQLYPIVGGNNLTEAVQESLKLLPHLLEYSGPIRTRLRTALFAAQLHHSPEEIFRSKFADRFPQPGA